MPEHNASGAALGYGIITAAFADSGSAAEERQKEEPKFIRIFLVDDEDALVEADQPLLGALDFGESEVAFYTCWVRITESDLSRVKREEFTLPATVISLEEKKKLADHLLSELEMDSFEEGMHHPAEKTLEEALEGNLQAPLWIYNILKDSLDNPVLAADILKCLGMIDYEKMRPIARRIVEEMLAQPDVRLRDAAVYAAEQWESGELVDILRGYAKGEKVKWLAQYMDEVADDISEE